MKNYIIVSVMCLTLISCSSQTITPDIGSLDLTVTIRPLCPVEPCNRTAVELAAIYESYSLIITSLTTKRVVLEPKVLYNGLNGSVKANRIAVGEYELNIKPENVFTKRGFPKIIKIEKDKITNLVIDIDTGLR